jgi:HPt (histidine-containing phosphotransfer) domain-containing protein
MSQSLQEFFALEAGEYLGRLERLVAGAEAPDAERLLRLARSVRGSARVAEAGEVARVARSLEGAARALRDGRLAWDGEVRERAAETVADLRALVAAEAVGRHPEPALADAAVARWGSAVPPTPAEPSLEEGRMQAFIERELDGVLAALDRTVASVAGDTGGLDELHPLLQRMRPIRGLSGVAELAPVMEVLEGVEELVRELLAGGLAAADAEQERLEAAREALRKLRGSAEPVSIAQLELRGAAALRAALRLRPGLDALAAESPKLGPALGELWDLLELAQREEL